jgi:DNA processing protein
MSDAERLEFWSCLALKHGLGSARLRKKILERYGLASLAVARPKAWLEQGLANSDQVSAFLGESWREGAERELAMAEEQGLAVLTWSDARYPQGLREIPDPPVLLYHSGDLSLLDSPGLAMVGARECSRYGMELAHRIAVDLAQQGITVISGMAYGIDREAHLGGLAGPGGSIAVLGTGLDLVYPACNRDLWRELSDKGLILTEFGPGTKPLGHNFPQRNRIISALSLGVLVVEAKSKSGSLITARLAMEQGREVFAVPGPVSLPSYRGCHGLINQGAKLVHNAEDILVELAPQLQAFLGQAARVKVPPRARPGPARPGLLEPQTKTRAFAGPPSRPRSPAKAPPSAPTPVDSSFPELDQSLEKSVAEHLAAAGTVHLDVLCRALERQAGELSGVLVLLEMKGVVRRLPGMYYRLA